MPPSSTERQFTQETKIRRTVNIRTLVEVKVVVPCRMEPLHFNIISRVLRQAVFVTETKEIPLQDFFALRQLTITRRAEQFETTSKFISSKAVFIFCNIKFLTKVNLLTSSDRS